MLLMRINLENNRFSLLRNVLILLPTQVTDIHALTAAKDNIFLLKQKAVKHAQKVNHTLKKLKHVSNYSMYLKLHQ